MIMYGVPDGQCRQENHLSLKVVEVGWGYNLYKKGSFIGTVTSYLEDAYPNGSGDSSYYYELI